MVNILEVIEALVETVHVQSVAPIGLTGIAIWYLEIGVAEHVGVATIDIRPVGRVTSDPVAGIVDVNVAVAGRYAAQLENIRRDHAIEHVCAVSTDVEGLGGRDCDVPVVRCGMLVLAGRGPAHGIVPNRQRTCCSYVAVERDVLVG